MKVRISARVYPSESEDRVLKAMKNLVPFEESIDEVELYQDSCCRVISVVLDGIDPLLKLRDSFRNNKVLDTARMLLVRGMIGRSTRIKLHKQAAFLGKVRLCSSDEESPLGTIDLDIEFDCDPKLFLDWIAPQTKDGKILREIKTSELRDLLVGASPTAHKSSSP